MIRVPLGLALVLTVSACVTPRQECMREVARQDREIQNIRDRTAEAELNLSRGHRIYSQEVETTKMATCEVNGVTVPCAEEATQTIKVPVPINVQAEEASIERNTRLLIQAIERRDAKQQTCSTL